MELIGCGIVYMTM